MPFDDKEDNKKINRGGVNNTPRRIIENRYLDLANTAIDEVELQLTTGETPAEKMKAAQYVLNQVKDIYKAKDAKSIAKMKAKGDSGGRKSKTPSSVTPVISFKTKK